MFNIIAENFTICLILSIIAILASYVLAYFVIRERNELNLVFFTWSALMPIGLLSPYLWVMDAGFFILIIAGKLLLFWAIILFLSTPEKEEDEDMQFLGHTAFTLMGIILVLVQGLGNSLNVRDSIKKEIKALKVERVLIQKEVKAIEAKTLDIRKEIVLSEYEKEMMLHKMNQ